MSLPLFYILALLDLQSEASINYKQCIPHVLFRALLPPVQPLVDAPLSLIFFPQ